MINYLCGRRLALVLLLAASLFLASRLEAAPPACAGRLEFPTRIVIDCQPGYATAHDSIEVYLRQPRPLDTTWQAALSYTDAIWVYRVGQRAALIINFSSAAGQVTARLYDDQTGDGQVGYTLADGQVTITESSYPTIKVLAQGGWWLADGRPNLNLDLEVDGRLQATIETLYLEQLKHDGKPDYTIHVRDNNQNGRAEYEWRQVYPGLSEDDGFYHSIVTANTADDEPGLPDSPFWPLISGEPVEIIKNYRQSLAPIHINWQQARLDLISEFVASRGSPHNYFVYSIRRIKGQLNPTNFESPFAFYDLGGPNANFPDLSIRVVYYPAGDIRKDAPVQQVDLTWRHNDSAGLVAPSWDYRLGLLGRNPAVGQVDFKEFSLAITPYEKLPAWVVNNRWDFASFVARERPEYLTTEHIYEWSTLEGVVIDHSLAVTETGRVDLQSINALPEYVRGESASDIRQFYRRIGLGLRGEFAPRLNDQPRVYFSPVDSKLHLLQAVQGVWTVAPSATLSLANLDGDGYLDQWIYQHAPATTQAVTITRQLNVTASYLLYGDDHGVVLRQATVKPSLFETLPPISAAEWQILGARLADHRPALAPDDLQGMLEQFPGKELRIEQARMRDVRLLPNGGFRFVLTLEPGFTASLADFFSAGELGPGDYVITYDQQFSAQPLTPPQISASVLTSQLQQIEQNSLGLTLINSGLEDAAGATLEVWASAGPAPPTLVASETLDLLAQQALTTTMAWAPALNGSWTISPTVRLIDGSLIELAPAHVLVEPKRRPGAELILQTSSTVAMLPLIGLVALTFAGLAGLLWWVHGGLALEIPMKQPEPQPSIHAGWYLMGPILYMVGIGIYFLLRYQGRWAETDSTVFGELIRDFSSAGRLVPAEGDVYPNGYAYQMISSSIVGLTGLEVATLQRLVYPLLAGLVVLPAWLFYREVTTNLRSATTATLLLFTQPEFLFVILRSSHEKFTRMLMLFGLFLLFRSFKVRHQPFVFITHVLLFYLAIYAFIASNNLLAHSFIFSIILSLGLAWIFGRRVKGIEQSSNVLQRLFYTTLISLGLVYLFTFYTYEPAQHDLLILRNIYQRIAALFLDVQQQSINPYTQVSTGWINLWIYFLVSIANWIILGVSFAIWVWNSWRWVWHQERPKSETAWLLWLLYGAFALQGIISALADASGAIGNLQHRVFPSFSIIAVGVIGSALGDWQPRRFLGVLRPGLALAVGSMSILSVLKATNEPTLSNKWTFYRENELVALAWADQHLHHEEIWTEFDERIAMAFFATRSLRDHENLLFANDLRFRTRTVLVTDVSRLRSDRLGRGLPLPPDSLRVYDNGGAEIYHLRPQTQYQE